MSSVFVLSSEEEQSSSPVKFPSRASLFIKPLFILLHLPTVEVTTNSRYYVGTLCFSRFLKFVFFSEGNANNLSLLTEHNLQICSAITFSLIEANFLFTVSVV
jgi:hypothetical protein